MIGKHETDPVGVRRRTCPLLKRRWEREERILWQTIVNHNNRDEDEDEDDDLIDTVPPAIRLYCLNSYEATRGIEQNDDLATDSDDNGDYWLDDGDFALPATDRWTGVDEMREVGWVR